MKITIIQLKGLTCTACQKLTSKRIKTIQDVEEVEVELDGKTTIYGTREITQDEVAKSLAGTHYSIIKAE